MLFVQAALGQLHHAEYQRTGMRSAWSYAHIWLGRTVIMLAIINGGIGLGPSLANASTGQIAAYSVVALIVAITYTSFYLVQWRRKSVEPEKLPRRSERRSERRPERRSERQSERQSERRSDRRSDRR